MGRKGHCNFTPDCLGCFCECLCDECVEADATDDSGQESKASRRIDMTPEQIAHLVLVGDWRKGWEFPEKLTMGLVHAVADAVEAERERAAKIVEERGCTTAHLCFDRLAKLIRDPNVEPDPDEADQK